MLVFTGLTLQIIRSCWRRCVTVGIRTTRRGCSPRETQLKDDPQPIDPNWHEATLVAPAARQSKRTLFHARLMQQSSFYRWVHAKLVLLHPAAARFLSGGGTRFDAIEFYARQLVQRPQYQSILRDWDFSREPNVDQPFNNERMAPVFEEALDYTGFALDQYLERAHRDNFRLVVLAESGLASQSREGWKLKRLSALLKSRGIPLIDQRAFIDSVGGHLSQVRFAHDAHWSAQGHRWAAEAMLKFLMENPTYCMSAPLPARQ